MEDYSGDSRLVTCEHTDISSIDRLILSTAGVRILDPEGVQLQMIDCRVHLKLRGQAQSFAGVSVSCVLPLSDPLRNVVFYTSEGAEIGILLDPDRIDRDSLEIVRRELACRYRMPAIVRVSSIRHRNGVDEWSVVTHSGTETFSTRGIDSIEDRGGGRFLVRDADGIRREIPDIEALDRRSRSLLSQVLH